MKRHLLAILSFAAFAVQAQTVSGLSLEPASPKAGEAVKATVSFDKADNPNCGIKIHWGDGQFSEAKINQAKDIPYAASHTYAKAGSYNVMVEPKRVDTTLKCSGKNITKAVAVAAVAAPAAAAPAAAPAAAASAAKPAAAAKPALCPEGWALAKPGQSAKTKAFTCTAKAGTKIPDAKLSCPGDLTYFENSKKGQLGCRV
jgi:ribosomal protein L12E/L44/L45/RPP1/RPP2